jgi:hypothetical protein
MKVASHILQSLIVLGMWVSREASKKAHGKSNVNTNNDIGVDQFAKKLAIAESSLCSKLAMLCRAFRWTSEDGNARSDIRVQWHKIGAISCSSSRSFPSM